MTAIASLVLTTIAVLLAVPSIVFAIEVFASLFALQKSDNREQETRPRTAIIVPAHNEAAGIAATLGDLKSQLLPGDRLLVVADNCSDDTAKIAAAEGAEVCIRSDPTRVGKGYALDWGLHHLEPDAPEIVVIIDADCRLEPNTIDRLAYFCQQTKRPVQSLYLMTTPLGSSVNHQVAEFAWRVRNFVRPLGLMAMGLPCQLMGTGMAFPWNAIRSVDLGSGHIVEDLKLSLDLARIGYAPIFHPSARVTSTFPTFAEGAKKQRQRWEHGQIGLIWTTAIPSLLEAIHERNLGLIILVADLIVPPLSLFLIFLTATLFVATLFAILEQSAVAFAVSVSSFVLFGLATALAWISQGRTVLPAKSLALIPAYLGTKLRHYASALLSGRTSRWVRTERK